MTTRTRSVLLSVCVLLLAVFITWLLAAMRAVMDIGGSCASGGPYVIVAPCPEHSTALTLVGMFGSAFIALVGTVFAVGLGAPNLLVPYWTFTIGGMVVTFLVYGFASDSAPVWGWIVGGLVNLPLALAGAYLMTPWQRLYDREPVPGAPLSRGAWWLVYLVVATAGVGIGSWSAWQWL